MTRSRLIACLALACLAPACAGGDPAAPSGVADAHTADSDALDGQGGPLPLELGRLGPDDALVPWSAGAETEVVQGPQGGIHVEAAVRFEAAGLGDAAFVALTGSVALSGVPVATLQVDRYAVLRGADGAYTTQVLPIIFFDSQSTTYLGDPPAPTPATVCVTASLADGREGTVCREVTLVDLEP